MRKEPGVRLKDGAYDVRIQVNGEPRQERFELTSTREERQAWRTAQKATGQRRTIPGSLAAFIASGLKRMAAMPTLKQRMAHAELWMQALGRDLPVGKLSAEQIDIVLQGWLKDGLAAETVRKRRASLMAFFQLHNGRNKSAFNPVRDSQAPKAPKPEARGIPFKTVLAIIDAMPMYVDVAKGHPARLCLSRLRVSVLAHTGLPPGMLSTLDASAVNLAAKTVRVTCRTKGGGVEARTLPLTDHAVVAFQALMAADGLRPFAIGPVNVSLKRAAATVGIRNVRLYDVRHSFGSELYRVTKDIAVVGRMMLHAPGSVMTLRYTLAAHAEVDEAAAKTLGATLTLVSSRPAKPVQKLAERVGRKSVKPSRQVG